MASAKATASDLSVGEPRERAVSNWDNTFYALSNTFGNAGEEVTLDKFLQGWCDQFMVSPHASAKTRAALHRAKRWSFKKSGDLAHNLGVATIFTGLGGLVSLVLLNIFLSDYNLALVLSLMFGPTAILGVSAATSFLFGLRAKKLSQRLRKFVREASDEEVIVQYSYDRELFQYSYDREPFRSYDGNKFYVSKNITPEELFEALTLLRVRNRTIDDVKRLHRDISMIKDSVKTEKSARLVELKQDEINNKKNLIVGQDQVIAEILMGGDPS